MSNSKIASIAKICEIFKNDFNIINYNDIKKALTDKNYKILVELFKQEKKGGMDTDPIHKQLATGEKQLEKSRAAIDTLRQKLEVKKAKKKRKEEEDTEYTKLSKQIEKDIRERLGEDNPCMHFPILQYKETCWFNSIINMFLLSDTFKILFGIALIKLYGEDLYIDINQLDKRSDLFTLIEKYKSIYENQSMYCKNNPDPHYIKLIFENLLYLFYYFYYNNGSPSRINKDIAALILTYSLLTKSSFNTYRLRIADNVTNHYAKVDIVKGSVAILAKDIFALICETIDYKGDDIDAIIYPLPSGYSFYFSHPNKNYIPLCAIFVMDPRGLGYTHTICGFRCNGKYYIYDSANHRTQGITEYNWADPDIAEKYTAIQEGTLDDSNLILMYPIIVFYIRKDSIFLFG